MVKQSFKKNKTNNLRTTSSYNILYWDHGMQLKAKALSLIWCFVYRWSRLIPMVMVLVKHNIFWDIVINQNGTSPSEHRHLLCRDTKGQLGLKFPKHYRYIWLIIHEILTNFIHFHLEIKDAHATICIVTRMSYMTIFIATQLLKQGLLCNQVHWVLLLQESEGIPPA